MTLTVAEAINIITAVKAPVLAVDACTLLDLLRAPARINKFRAEQVREAKFLLGKAGQTPPKLHLVIVKQALSEFVKHQGNVAATGQAALDELDEEITRIVQQHRELGIEVLNVPTFSQSGFVQAAQLIAEEYAKIALEIDDNAYGDAALRRVIGNRRPSKKGDSGADCLITETLLDLCRGLKTAGHAEDKVFLTTNTNDYADSRRVHPDISADFSAVDATCALSFLEARYLLFPS